MSNNEFDFEAKSSDSKHRVGVFIRNSLNYRRRIDLEKKNCHLIIIDLFGNKLVRLITLYRSFRPPNSESPSAFFQKQLEIIKNNIIPNTVLLGDFNLDFEKQFPIDYPHARLFTELNLLLSDHNLIQLVDFPTWSRNVNNSLKQSTLDHIYVNVINLVVNCYSFHPPFGDHLPVVVEISCSKPLIKKSIRRNWCNYSAFGCVSRFGTVDFAIDSFTVQEYWNKLENLIINLVDQIVPLTEFNNEICSGLKPPLLIRNKINKRKRLKKKLKISPSPSVFSEIKAIDKEIKSYFYLSKAKLIQSKILPGNSHSLWSAIKVAKNHSSNSIPKNLTLAGQPVNECEAANAFACYFHDKIVEIKNNTLIDTSVYNGKRKLLVDNRFFMSEADVLACMNSLKLKNCEGFDRIPLRIICDAKEHLLAPLTILFRKIYDQKSIPEQWKMAKIIPIFKKGSKTAIENYRPIANQCCISKIFEKLILRQINYLESINKLDFTGKQQHGFKKNKSTLTAGLLLQSLIARATDDNNYALMASLDLSAAFDLVNVRLLSKRLRIIGLPSDLIELIVVWLSDRKFYVELDGVCSQIYDSNDGTIQGSVLGPILYAIFVSPLFDLTEITNFADDNFVLQFNTQINALIRDMEMRLEMIVKWLKDSGLRVNESKTELCLFHRNDTRSISISIQDQQIFSKKSMNVLGVTFDSKLNWCEQVSNSIKKSNKALYALRMIKPYLTAPVMKSILVSNYYSILYYNAEIWLTNNLSHDSKQQLLSASANAIRQCIPQPNPFISFEKIHMNAKISTPMQIGLFKLSLLLHKKFNSIETNKDWQDLVHQIVITGRQTLFSCHQNNKYKIGLNLNINKFYCLNCKIKLNDFNQSFLQFKFLMKKSFKLYE